MTKDFGELEYGAIQGVSNQESSVDYEQFDFLSSHDEETFFEPLPDVSHYSDEQLCGKNGKRVAETIDDYERVLIELKIKIMEICQKPDLTSELKSDLIRYAAKQAGHPLDHNRVVQILCDEHNRQKYGSSLVVINKHQGAQWFQSVQRHIIEDLVMAEELNIIGGLSGAAKTNFTAMLLSSLMNHDREPRFLGFKVNRDLVNQVFFIGLDGGRNVYTPIFRNTGLIRDGIPVDGFNFIPNESGWGITNTNLDKLEALLKKAPSSIVVVDSFLAASQAAESMRPAVVVARILDLKLLRERYGATPILLAHQKKESTQEFTGADSLRGHGSIPAFAGQIITLNFLDQKSKVNGKAVPDRKSPKRRLVAGHRGTLIDLLVELDFQGGTVKSHGDFYDAFLSLQSEEQLNEDLDGPSLQTKIKGLSQGKRDVLEALRGYDAPILQTTLVSNSGINKGTVSRNLKALTAERDRGPLVTEYETSDGKVYEVSYSIKQELLQKY